MNFLCRIGFHQKRLVKHFISTNIETNTYSLNFYGKECLFCKTRFLEEIEGSWALSTTLYEAEQWVGQRSKRVRKASHLSLIKKD